ncbi:MAG: hypothetical protein RIA72_16030 [Sphingopyxis sp.]|uniref:hypothetical protein n=1 Tax=Sphingopyxis sp. TaxID=1908224 RepID=UPI0032F01FA2
MNTYLLSYSPFEPKISYSQLATFIKDNRKVTQWYSPFLGTYVLKSVEPLSSLAESFRGAFDGAPFILTQAFPSHMGGAQTDLVWNWINNHGFPSSDQTFLPAREQ